MAILVHKCPHCGTDHASLHIAAGTAGTTEVWWSAHLYCPKCRMPSAAQLVSYSAANSMSHVLQHVGDPQDQGWEIGGFWPELPEPNIPDLLPPDVSRVYLQAERNFPIEGNEEAAGTMYRKSLDIGLKKIDPALTGTLGAKIKALAKAGKLTADIETWSDSVRDLGNDAAHEEDPISRPDLEALRDFAEMVLRYLFTLPNMVKKRRGEKLDWEIEATT